MRNNYKALIMVLSILLILILIALLITVFDSNITYRFDFNEQGEINNYINENYGQSVAIYEVKTGEIKSYITSSSNITSFNIEEIFIGENEKIKEMFVNDGDIVTKGQLLMKTTQDGGYNRNIKASNSGKFYIVQEDNGIKKYMIYDTKETGVVIKVKEKEINNISLGQKTIVSLINSNDIYIGNVSFISKIPNSEGKFYVQISIPNDVDNNIKYGYLANVKIECEVNEEATVVPYEVINLDDTLGEYFVIEDKYIEYFEKNLIDDNMKIFIKTGIFDIDGVEVKEGLEPGMKILYWK